MEKDQCKIVIEPDDLKKLDSEQKVVILCFDITKYSKATQFGCCCLGIFVLYLVYGYLLELIFTFEGSKQNGWYLTLVQFGYYALFGWSEKYFLGCMERRIPLRIYIILAALTLGTMGFSNTSLQYLNYPTQVIFKSCKLIPVLIGGILIQKKRYGKLDFLAAICMCIGLTWFTLADIYTTPTFNTMGVIFITAALICDAAIGNVQEKIMVKYKASNTEVVFYSYAIGFIYLFIILLATGKFFPGFNFCYSNPIPTYGYGLLFSACGYLGIQIILTLVKTCGALVAATVTTFRKAMSIVLSFIFFSKPFTMSYLWSGLIVVLGIYLNILAKKKKNFNFTEIRFGQCHFPKIIIKFFRFKNFSQFKQSKRELDVTI